MKVQCPAKVNLFLEVTGKRPDGYHRLATLFAKINIYDVLEFTATAPMPALVAASTVAPEVIERLRAALLGAAERSWFGALAEVLQLEGFAPVTGSTYSVLLDWDHAAKQAGYPHPA